MASTGASNPFEDPVQAPVSAEVQSAGHGQAVAATPAPQSTNAVPTTLAVGRDASLTLGTDSLVVQGMKGGNAKNKGALTFPR